jgi:hypothetical protein
LARAGQDGDRKNKPPSATRSSASSVASSGWRAKVELTTATAAKTERRQAFK